MHNHEFSGHEFDRYRVHHLLGRGHASDIYLGEEIYQRMPVAIKMLPALFSATEKAKFRTQAASLTHLRHPYLIPVLDFGLYGDYAYLVMNYVPNGHLRQRYPRGTRVPMATVLSFVHQIAQALDYLHRHNLVHRDVKPHNMLVSANNEILLSDLGITIISPSLVPGNYDFEGTVPYAAPEQLMGRPRRSSDQYSLAVAIYEWLSGSWPFVGSFDEIVYQHLNEDPPPFRRYGAEITPEIEEVIFKALAKNPEERFVTVGAFAATLMQACLLDTTNHPSQHSSSRRQFMTPLPFQV
jgi:serine/threonine-protein kinase